MAINRVPFEVKWSQVVYIPPAHVTATSNDGEGARMRMVQDVSEPAGTPTNAALREDTQIMPVDGPTMPIDKTDSITVPKSHEKTIPITSSDSITKQTHDTTLTPSTPAHSLRLGSHVMLTPGLIGLLSENPLLRASLKGLGLGG
jgi:hypothetical protein